MVRIAAVLVALALAGCSAEPAGPATARPSGEIPTDPGLATGAIRGVVTDDAQLPVQGVQVHLDGTQESISNEAGGFGFDDVPVGTHQLTFRHEGFESKELRVDVLEDQATTARISLLAKASSGAYYESMTNAGIAFCGVSGYGPLWNNGSARGNVCVLAAQAGQEDIDRSQIRWFFRFTNASGFISETFWQASSSSTKGMDLLWTPLGDDGARTPGLAKDCCSGSPTSPMWLRVPYESVAATIKNFTTQSCPLPDCMLLSYHYVRGGTLGPPVDVGVALQQRYDTWVTTFFNGPLPTEFTIQPEG